MSFNVLRGRQVILPLWSLEDYVGASVALAEDQWLLGFQYELPCSAMVLSLYVAL